MSELRSGRKLLVRRAVTTYKAALIGTLRLLKQNYTLGQLYFVNVENGVAESRQ
ncbi:MAG: hypothetical protein KME27_17515 [Lyngbya sp. HA4199-MV5]|jgi:hypothetical protein|nr:hypothetical protein [Lyngbya sp. HA4199-MV5]